MLVDINAFNTLRRGRYISNLPNMNETIKNWKPPINVKLPCNSTIINFQATRLFSHKILGI